MKKLLKRFNSWNLPTRIGIILGILSLIFTIFYGGLDINNNIIGNQNTNVVGNENIVNSVVNNYYNETITKWKESTKYLLVEKKSFNKYCPFSSANNLIFTNKSSISLWFRLYNSSDSQIQNHLENHTYNATFIKDGKLGSALRYLGPNFMEDNQRNILQIFNNQSIDSIKILIKNDEILNMNLIDSNGNEHLTSYTTKNTFYEWNFLVLTLNDNGVVQLYINGDLVNTLNMQQIPFYANTLYLGTNLEQEHCLNGDLDEIGIFSSTLNDIDVKQLYNFNNGCSYGEKCYTQNSFIFRLKWYIYKLFN